MLDICWSSVDDHLNVRQNYLRTSSSIEFGWNLDLLQGGVNLIYDDSCCVTSSFSIRSDISHEDLFVSCQSSSKTVLVLIAWSRCFSPEAKSHRVQNSRFQLQHFEAFESWAWHSTATSNETAVRAFCNFWKTGILFGHHYSKVHSGP